MCVLWRVGTMSLKPQVLTSGEDSWGIELLGRVKSRGKPAVWQEDVLWLVRAQPGCARRLVEMLAENEEAGGP